MLRVGLTGGLGSGKSTVAAIFSELGADVIEADQLGRALMQPGQAVYSEILRVFGQQVVSPDGQLNRAHLATLAFHDGRLNELNAIVHPAAIAAQRIWTQQVFDRNPNAIAIIESALIFEVERDARLRGESEGLMADWRNRFDKVIVVTVPDGIKIARYVSRISPNAWSDQVADDARSRLARQLPDAEKIACADYVIENGGSLADLHRDVVDVWTDLLRCAKRAASSI